MYIYINMYIHVYIHIVYNLDIGPLIAQDLRGPARARGPEGLQVSILSAISSCILSGICV